MITAKNIEDIGFELSMSPFTGKMQWGIGKREVRLGDDKTTVPIIYYNPKEKRVSCIMGEFTNISRECKSVDEVIKFIECINFLFRLDIKIN